MKPTDSQLRQMFVRATDEAVPPAPWLETEVINAMRRPRAVRRPWRTEGAIGDFPQGLRLAASLAALLIAFAGVSVLLMSARGHILPESGGRSTTVQTASPGPRVTFTPSPAVRAPNWPAGDMVPAQLAGSWQLQTNSRQIDLGGYSFQVREPSRCRPDFGTTWVCTSGNVVVNGQEVDFITDTCSPQAGNTFVGEFGYEKYFYSLSGNTLTLTKPTDPGWSDCGFGLQGTYTKIS